jgi:hypothetical protein
METFLICLTFIIIFGYITFTTRELILKYFDIHAPIKIDITQEIKQDVEDLKTRLSGMELSRGMNVRRQQ